MSLEAWGDDGDADRPYTQDRVDELLAEAEAEHWDEIDKCPRTGAAFLLYGVHDTDNGKSWSKGDDWVAIGLWDIWREPQNWVFSKDGTPMWSKPLLWREVPFDGARAAAKSCGCVS